MKLLRYKTLTGAIKVLTGLRIGGGTERIEIGGVDNPIIREPVKDFPYIPGSSIKGKMRSLLELKHGKVEPGGEHHKWCGDLKCFVCRGFGTGAGEKAKLGPGRLVVRDCKVTDGSEKALKRLKEEKGLNYAELKQENVINRVTVVAVPRIMERVPAGIEFDFSLSYRVFDDGDDGTTDEENFKYVLEGLGLIEQDALGSCGSRGYGKVEFVCLKDENGNTVTLPGD